MTHPTRCDRCGKPIELATGLFRTNPIKETPAFWSCEECLTPAERDEHQVDDPNQLFNLIRKSEPWLR